MESNLSANLSATKQPAPNFSIFTKQKTNDTSSGVEEKPKREYKMPYVGVIELPNISKTPLSDTLSIKKQENPHTVYKMPQSINDNIKNPHTLASIGIIVCGILALMGLKK